MDTPDPHAAELPLLPLGDSCHPDKLISEVAMVAMPQGWSHEEGGGVTFYFEEDFPEEIEASVNKKALELGWYRPDSEE